MYVKEPYAAATKGGGIQPGNQESTIQLYEEEGEPNRELQRV